MRTRRTPNSAASSDSSAAVAGVISPDSGRLAMNPEGSRMLEAAVGMYTISAPGPPASSTNRRSTAGSPCGSPAPERMSAPCLGPTAWAHADPELATPRASARHHRRAEIFKIASSCFCLTPKLSCKRSSRQAAHQYVRLSSVHPLSRNASDVLALVSCSVSLGNIAASSVLLALPARSRPPHAIDDARKHDDDKGET